MSSTDPELPFDDTRHVRAPRPELPLTPYDRGTSSGHSGSKTSEERSVRRDTSGQTAMTQKKMLDLVDEQGRVGLTVAEARRLVPAEHHGTISGALSNLHQKGLIERLKNRREGCQVYVTPDMVFTRETVPHGRNRNTRLTSDETEFIGRVTRYKEGFDSSPNPTFPVSKNVMTRLLGIIERLS